MCTEFATVQGMPLHSSNNSKKQRENGMNTCRFLIYLIKLKLQNNRLYVQRELLHFLRFSPSNTKKHSRFPVSHSSQIVCVSRFLAFSLCDFVVCSRGQIQTLMSFTNSRYCFTKQQTCHLTRCQSRTDYQRFGIWLCRYF